MGDRYSINDYDLFIDAKNVQAVENVLDDLWKRNIAQIHWEVVKDVDGNGTGLIFGQATSSGLKDLETIAQFVQDGGYIELELDSEPSQLFRFVFRNGKVKRVNAQITFPE